MTQPIASDGATIVNRLLLAIDIQRSAWTPEREPVFAAIRAAAAIYQRMMVTVFINEREFIGSLRLPDEAYQYSVDWRFRVFPHLIKRTCGVNPFTIARELSEHRLAGVDLAGFETDAAIVDTARAFAHAGLHVRVRTDLCAGRHHHRALSVLAREIGQEHLVEQP